MKYICKIHRGTDVYYLHDMYLSSQQADELQSEKSRFEETVGAMSEQLMDFVEKMNKLEKESVSPHCAVK